MNIKPSSTRTAPSRVIPAGKRPRTPSTNIKRILVPVDFSDASMPALGYAKFLANICGASLLLVHVIEPLYLGSELAYLQADNPEVRREVTHKLDALRMKSFEGGQITTAIRVGAPFSEIVDLAKKTKTDLIVMTTHGYTGLRHILVGSTAERVVRHASCPVCVVRSKPLRKPKKMRRAAAAHDNKER